MSGCCRPHARSAARLFGWRATSYRKRFEKKGLEASQKQLVALIEDVGVDGATILEIGCGVGHLHQSLLESGAAAATGVDLTEAMIESAKQWASDRGLDSRTQYIVGDFMELDDIARHDLAILDKVLCCYPDAPGMLRRCAASGASAIAFSIPRDLWFNRFTFEAMAMGLKLVGSKFRPFVHDPEGLDSLLGRLGYRVKGEDNTTLWLSRTYSLI